MKILSIKGTFQETGKIELKNMKTIEWENLTDENLPVIKPGSNIEVNISIEKQDLLTGKNGIIWGTYDLRQAEIIQSALLAQHIVSKIEILEYLESKLFMICVSNSNDTDTAIDFIWRGNNGLRLRPDWSYKSKIENESFIKWLSGQ